MKKRTGFSGFTLVELAVTMGIASLIAVMAYPSIRAIYPKYRLEKAVRIVSQELVLTRLRAISKNREYRMVMDWNNNSYQVQQGNASSSSTSWTSVYSGSGAANWPGAIIYVPPSEPLTDDAIVFSPEGNVTNAGTNSVARIYVQGAGLERRTVVEVGTGRVRVERNENGAWIDERKLKG